MLQNEPLVAKIGPDTAENGPSKVWYTGIPVQAPPIPVHPKPRGRPAPPSPSAGARGAFESREGPVLVASPATGT